MHQFEAVFLWLALPVLFFLGWSYTAIMLRGSLGTLKEKSIVLLIAHPDDEAMFFAPAVQALTKPELGNHLKILCLSNGNADGLGQIRQQEIVTSALRLGLRSSSDVLVLDDPRFPDGFRPWNAETISAQLASLFSNPASSGPRRKNATHAPTAVRPEASIDALITFDSSGVSSHPNHISLFHGASHWVRSLTAGAASGWENPVALYTLTSVNIARKYSGVLDAPFTLAWNAGGNFVRKGRSVAGRPDRMLFVSDVGLWVKAMGTMVNAHRSQMVWFRWGWVALGRYMVVNDLQRVDVG